MILKLLNSELRKNPLLNTVTFILMSLTCILFILSSILTGTLLGSVEDLMSRSRVPDVIQMHAGAYNGEALKNFILEHPEIEDFQIQHFLNLETGSILLNSEVLSDPSQEYGAVCQNEKFDFLLDEDGKTADPKPGELFLPVSLKSTSSLKPGDTVALCGIPLRFAGYIRDAQMNSAMASSKRILISKEDYDRIQEMTGSDHLSEQEVLIEFMLSSQADTNVFMSEYSSADLPASGPMISKSMIRMINALSDGTMIFILILSALLILAVSLVCIRLILDLQIEKDRRESAILRCIGISRQSLRRLMLSRYLLILACSLLCGSLLAALLASPLGAQLRMLYGSAADQKLMAVSFGTGICLCVLLLICPVIFAIRKSERLSPLQALRSPQTMKDRAHTGFRIILVSAFCILLTLIPVSLLQTVRNPGFVSWMGIGQAPVRLDLRSADTGLQSLQAQELLNSDPAVEKFSVLQTFPLQFETDDGQRLSILTECGDHQAFPVRYLKGRAPAETEEIALSALYASELNLKCGDTLSLIQGSDSVSYRVCGIYSDITNGGKTAKAVLGPDDLNPVWSVIYADLAGGTDQNAWITAMNASGFHCVSIADYVRETLKETISALSKAAWITGFLSVLVIFTVLALFIRLDVERKRDDLSLKKMLGFASPDLIRHDAGKNAVYLAAGIVIGVLAGQLFGEKLCGLLLKVLGAEGFSFLSEPVMIYGILPVLILSAGIAAILLGLQSVRKIAPIECVRGKE